jgi:hypothetical protein
VGKFLCALEWELLIYFLTICNILRKFGGFYGNFVYFVVIWYIFPSLAQKSGKPGTYMLALMRVCKASE